LAFYLVCAQIRPGLEGELRQRLETREFELMRPFGHSLSSALAEARCDPETGLLAWKEECYCQPPLAQERAAVLDRYFEPLQTERPDRGQGWERIGSLPYAWPQPSTT
jgi:hypothetical protein